ncbi:hypothetical protein HW555_009216 [Spodoptera exigua]|uniref:Centrosome-associated zinc finger protein CP190 n=1 Tax=Spodoptera exigua TaxID=7107 RepID=A0A835GB43_SPOEX|nr:hypothetical protein HW555_009216 [Spodoptera exigua]
MSDKKKVKVDNWGIYFLQRLKHFFNRTDYCDLTLQFQDNAQLKVHRLVLSACTEYFELLERTCEMYEDCLVMPDDLQADVIVPIVNFMYTGNLEFHVELAEKLYQTSQVLNMPVLTKLLESHRPPHLKAPTHSYSGKKFTKQSEPKKSSVGVKRSYGKAFDNVVYKHKKSYQTVTKSDNATNSMYRPPSPLSAEAFTPQRSVIEDPRPTRYEIPEELESDNLLQNSFSNISYTSQPLVVHPDTVKRYKAAKRNTLFGESSNSKKLSGMSTVDIVECKRIVSKDESIFNESNRDHSFNDESDLFNASYVESERDSSQLFDQMLDNNGGPKVTIETKDSKAASNLDHARIISEVLKKYPHLVKSNKNIKLKILDPIPSKGKKQAKPAAASNFTESKPLNMKSSEDDFTYETDVIDSKQAAKLIAMGAENVKGPWICLICGTPGKALHFNSYYKFRRHLVDVHHEKPVANICEYCGLRSLKRNYLLHHLYAQHAVPPPPQYHFPKCNMCSYIALTEGLLVKHKLTHKDIRNFRCNVCSVAFSSSSQLLIHIQNTGHKYSSERKNNLQCVYCLKVFLREANLYAHLKTHHKKEAKTDCIIESSDDEKEDEKPRSISIKYEASTSYDNDYDEMDIQFPSHQTSTSDKHSTPRRQPITNLRQKILNPGFSTPKSNQKLKPGKSSSNSQSQNDFFQDIKLPIEGSSEEIVVIDNDEYIMKDNQLIPRKKTLNQDFILSDIVEPNSVLPTTSVEYSNVENATIEESVQPQSSMIIKKSANLNQPIQIVVSNEEEYKALMNSNHPIIFDNGDTTKTLTVLTTQHNTGMETSTIDLDNTSSSEMMILPSEYPLNVTEAVSTDNNIVVVYSHDDQNKQYQILTTGGIGAQFVQSSGMLTQTFETVSTATPAMNRVEQNWQNNIENLESQQIQIAHEHSDHNATTDHLDELPEVHMGSEPQKDTAAGETEISLNPPEEIIEQINNKQSNNSEPSNMPITANETNDIHTNQNNIVEPMEIQNVQEQPLENAMDLPPVSENIIEQPMEAESIVEQPIGIEVVQEQSMTTDNVEQPIENENIGEQAIETEYVIEQPLEADIVMEPQLDSCIANELKMPVNTEIQGQQAQVIAIASKIEEPVMSTNVGEQTIGSENMKDQPAEGETVLEHRVPSNILEKAIEGENVMEQTDELKNMLEQPVESENILEQQSSSIENSTIQTTLQDNTSSQSASEYQELANEDERTGNTESPNNQQPQELMESQAYDDIVEINNTSQEQTINPKETASKIQNLALEWSEDEYDVREDQDHSNKMSKTKMDTQKIPFIDDGPELEESIENIQQEMQKQMASQTPQIETPDVETEESAVSSQEEDSSSQEMQLPPLIDSPVHGPIPNPQVQQKLSSLLNDWEDNDSQEDIIADNTTHENILPKTDTNKPQDIPKNDNIRSLVSDWDDDDDKE